MRVFTDTGKSPAPSFTALITARAMAGFFIIAAPPPCFSIDLSGQPIFISIPSKPSFRQSLAALFIFSAFEPNICATIGCSLLENFKSIKSFSLALGHARPSAETNSVQNISGLSHLAMTRLKAQSVTSAIGARQKIGFLIFSQKFFTIILDKHNLIVRYQLKY